MMKQLQKEHQQIACILRKLLVPASLAFGFEIN
jgi:hypothetical protein